MTEVRMRLRQKGQQFPTQDYYRHHHHHGPANPASCIPSTTRQETRSLFDQPQVEAFLLAFGDNDYPLPETVRVLDEIVTDYIIETCHEAAAVAHHARRAKIKLDDFKFMLRRDTGKLGRVSEMLETDKELKRKRKAFDTDEGAVLQKGDAKEEEEPTQKKGGPDEGERKKKKKKKDKIKKEKFADDESVV